MLSTEREGGKGREESSGTSRPPPPTTLAPLSGSRLHSEVSFKLMKTFPSTAALQLSSSSHHLLIHLWAAICWPDSLSCRTLTGPEVLRVVMAGSEERSLNLGLWVLLLLSAGMEEVVEGCSCLPAHPQQLFCSSEIGKSLGGWVKGFWSLSGLELF